MKIILEYIDDESLTKEEVVHNVRLRYGDNANVQVLPQDQSPEGFIKFGIRELIAIDQIEYHFDYKGGRGYRESLKNRKREIVDLMESLLNEVTNEIEEELK
jgi:hypothetical protein